LFYRAHLPVFAIALPACETFPVYFRHGGHVRLLPVPEAPFVRNLLIFSFISDTLPLFPGGSGARNEIPNSKGQNPKSKFQIPKAKFQIPKAKFQRR